MVSLIINQLHGEALAEEELNTERAREAVTDACIGLCHEWEINVEWVRPLKI